MFNFTMCGCTAIFKDPPLGIKRALTDSLSKNAHASAADGATAEHGKGTISIPKPKGQAQLMSQQGMVSKRPRQSGVSRLAADQKSVKLSGLA
jgi:hypothetical protein